MLYPLSYEGKSSLQESNLPESSPAYDVRQSVKVRLGL